MRFCKRCIQNFNAGKIHLHLVRTLHAGKRHAGMKDGITRAYESQKEAVFGRLRKANEKYEEIVGLVDVQDAQKRVKEAETVFLEARATERMILREMVETREKLKQVRERLSHVDYSNPMYLQLASDQHELVNEEERQKSTLEEAEDHERDSFQNLSNIMRESYEQERARVERTKNWSIIGTVIGTIIGMMGSIYMNRVRTKDLLKAVQDSAHKEDLTSKLESLTAATEQKQAAVVTALKMVSENLEEMSDALQVKNLETLAGFVSDPMTDQSSAAKTFSQKPKPPEQASITIEALTEEIGQYNEALIALSNAVAALSNYATPGSSDGTRNIELLLQSQDKAIVGLRARMDEAVAAANNMNLSTVSTRLNEMNEKISILLAAPYTEGSGPVIVELPPEEEKGPNWPIGVRDFLVWGAILGGLCAFIKF